MPSYLQIENISKSYGPKVLFENISFNVNEGDKIALIAPNGTGKTSLMRILAGKDKSDSGGRIMFLRDVRIAFLEQDYEYDKDASVLQQAGGSQRAKELLTSFKLGDFDRKMSTLSGGEVKRVALTQLLAQDADFYIMDEPTNHLDIDAVEYLESFLSHSRCTLLMVTHDRYFLDRVCNIVMELDHGAVYTYRGNYQNYLEQREARISNYNAETAKVRNLLRRELEWIHATPCARSGKAKYRIDAFKELKERASQVYTSTHIDMSELRVTARSGTKIIDCRNLGCRFPSQGGDVVILKDFTYNFIRGERVGVVGRNGIGKSTFIDLLSGSLSEAAIVDGIIERGESLKIGYYRQEGMQFDEQQTVMETVPDMHLLNRFLFPHDMFTTKIARLSGGERRRLYLLTILARNPNMLILDEPTNDLDIVTLNILEEYLKDYPGTLIIVSHDRHFLDRVADHLLVFCGNGLVKDFVGNFSEYRAFVKDCGQSFKKEKSSPQAERKRTSRTSLSFKEKRELEQIVEELGLLADEKRILEEQLNSGILQYDLLQRVSSRIGEIIALTEEKETRWLELSMKEEAQNG